MGRKSKSCFPNVAEEDIKKGGGERDILAHRGKLFGKPVTMFNLKIHLMTSLIFI